MTALFVTPLDDGTGVERTILSGIHAYYEPEELVGKTLLAITNLPPRPMMDIESCGMLISAVHHEEGEEKLHLLNFDANWYRYLWDEDAQAAHAQDRKNLQASDVRDESAGTDVDAMEAIARKTPLSKHHRPAWDLDVLRGLGMQAAADTEVWKQVWTKEERINNASTPMFLVEGHKGGESPLTMRYELGQ